MSIMYMVRRWPATLRLAAAAVSLGALFAGWSLAQALKVPEISAELSDTSNVIAALGDEPVGRLASIPAAVDVDPFNPERRRPSQRYRLASEVVEVPQVNPRQRVQVRYIGIITAIQEDGTRVEYGAFQLGNLPQQILVPGEKLGEYTIAKFDSKTATLTGSGGALLEVSTQSTGR